MRTRSIIEIGEHSVYGPGLARGGMVLDAGANRGRFSREIAARFPVSTCAIEANPTLADALREDGMHVLDGALAAASGRVTFNIGTNDEASSTRAPKQRGHLVVKERVEVRARTLMELLGELALARVACVKLDIEGAEVDVVQSLGPSARDLCPQWTIEFHDDEEFQLCDREEVDAAIATMTKAGFSALSRNWPSRTNVLFLDRRALSIGLLAWFILKFRYQYLAVVWRLLRRS
jgi:FkbM family methyltransferase